MGKERKVPRLRFPGFTDPWEQRKFCDIADIKTGPFGSTLHAGDYVDDGTPIITTEHFKNGSLPNAKESLPQVSDEDYKRLSSYILNEGDIVFSRVGSVDINAVTTRFQEGWLFSGRVLRARPKDSVDSIFMHALLETETVKKNIRDRAVGQTMPSINTEILGVTPLVFPQDLEEQTKIGKVISELDNLITLHQRKYEALKEYKSGMLQKMFPREGQRVPEVRFPGFTDSWEQRKLSELTDYSNGTGHEEYVVAQGKYELITLKSINSEGELVSSEKYVDEEFETLKQGTLIMMLSEQAKGMLGMTTVIPCNDRYVLNQRVAALNLHDKIDASFLTKAINNKQAYFEQMGAGTKVQNISKGHVENCLIDIPCYEEQQRIGGYFNNLDNLITLHQRKCDELKKYKNGLLQQMFI